MLYNRKKKRLSKKRTSFVPFFALSPVATYHMPRKFGVVSKTSTEGYHAGAKCTRTLQCMSVLV